MWLYVAVLLAACTESRSEEGPVDTQVPSAGAAISFSDIAATSVTVSWGLADDDRTTTNGLSYKLVRAAEAAEIDTLAELDAITEGPGLVHDYLREVTSKEVSGLEPAVSYAFAVAVRDRTGNRALYAPAIVTTLDVSAPTPGAGIGYSDITATSLTVSWGAASDDVTPADRAQYKVVMARAASAIDTLAEVHALTSAPGLVQDFTANLTSKAVTGLSASTGYAFAVVVRDERGNEALYSPVTVATPDVAPPSVGTPITFSDVAAHGVTVHWGLGSDAVTWPAGLKYKVVKASDAAAIDTLEEVDAIMKGAGLVADFAAGIASVAVTGLASSTSYAFAVVVKDTAGNRALYAPATVMTLDASAPTVGTAVSVSNVTGSGLSLSWGAATDDLTAQDALQYKVVKAGSADAIDTLEEIALISAGGDLVQDFTAGLLSKAVSGLSSGTSYAFAVVVKDEQGNQAIYTPVTYSTVDDTTPIAGAALSFANVSTNSLTVSWGKATDDVSSQADLHYKLVQSSSTSSVDTIAEVDAITTGPSLVMDFTADVATRNVTGLASSAVYAFALLVRDAVGNKTLYAPATVSTLDVSAPTPGLALSFADLTASSVTVNWGAASDDITTPASLEYKLVTAASATSIDTLAEADAISGAGLVRDFAANLTSKSVTGLAASTSYAFAVVVRDAAGNKALYAPATASTPDEPAPTPGTGITFSAVSSSSITVNWGVASDETTAQASLQYKVVRATTAAAIDSEAEADAVAGADLLLDWSTNVTSTTVGGLTAGDYHFYAVVVRDVAQKMALYAPLSRVAGRIFYSSTSTASSNLGGPAGADTICGTSRDSRAASDVTPKALLASGDARRACSAANCTSAAENVDWPLLANTTYYNVDGGVIGTTNAAGIFSFPLTSAMVPGGSYHYAGFNNDWTSNASNCSGYTEDSSSTLNYLGNASQTSVSAIFDATTFCSSTGSIGIRVMCVEP